MPGLRVGAEAGERSEARNGSWSGVTWARQGPTTPANFKTNPEKLQETQQKVRDTDPNRCYSAKNNIAICTISTFMSTPLLFIVLVIGIII